MERETIEEVIDTDTEEETEGEKVTSEEESNGDSKEVEESSETKDDKPEDTSSKPKQSAEERKKYAQMRREREAQEREESIRKAKQEGVIEGLGGTNPYTGEKIEDDIDFKLYQEMKDAESKGYDPNDVKDMLKYRKNVELEIKKQEESKLESAKRIQEDINKFVNNHPDVNVKELLSKEDFKNFANDLLGNVSLDKIYEKYNMFQNSSKKRAEEIAIEEKARRVSSPGPVKTDIENTVLDISKLSQMPREEISEKYDEIMKVYFKN